MPNDAAPPVPARAAPAETGRLAAGILVTLAGVMIFACTNAMAKLMSADYPVGEVLFARSLVVLALLLPGITRADWAALRESGRPSLHVARSLLSAVEVGCFYWAITALPLAGGTVIYLAAPIYVTALAALLLRERVGWRRWLAVLAGFAGVAIALDPAGMPMDAHTAVAVAGSLMYAVSLVITRRLRGVPTRLLVACQVLPLFAGSAATAAWGWVMPSLADALVLALFGVMSMAAYLCVNRGLQLAPASAVTPFHYSSIVWASLLGAMVFAERPSTGMVVGAVIIVAAGLLVLERRPAPGLTRPS